MVFGAGETTVTVNEDREVVGAGADGEEAMDEAPGEATSRDEGERIVEVKKQVRGKVGRTDRVLRSRAE